MFLTQRSLRTRTPCNWTGHSPALDLPSSKPPRAIEYSTHKLSSSLDVPFLPRILFLFMTLPRRMGDRGRPRLLLFLWCYNPNLNLGVLPLFRIPPGLLARICFQPDSPAASLPWILKLFTPSVPCSVLKSEHFSFFGLPGSPSLRP